jgi:hypothetical protein
MDQTFATPVEVEKAGIQFAQKWIDDGKPTQTYGRSNVTIFGQGFMVD